MVVGMSRILRLTTSVPCIVELPVDVMASGSGTHLRWYTILTGSPVPSHVLVVLCDLFSKFSEVWVGEGDVGGGTEDVREEGVKWALCFNTFFATLQLFDMSSGPERRRGINQRRRKVNLWYWRNSQHWET